jgi:hypothetical protein
VQSWGRQFILNPFADRKQGGTPVRVVADQDNTIVSVNGSVVATLSAGGIYQYNYWESPTVTSTSINTGMLLTSTKPILVSVYMRGGGSFLGETGDPAMAFIPPFEQYLTKYTVVSAPGNAAQLMNLMVPTASRSSVRYDGRALIASDFENSWATVGGSTYSVAQIKSTQGSHTITAAQAFGLVVYGANSYNSYAYVGGMSLSSIGLVDSVTMTTQAGYTGSVGQQVCVSAVILDANGAGLVGVRVDGSVTGANAGAVLVGTSDASGTAQLCYTASTAGTDNVVLTSNQLTATTSVTWTEVAPSISYNPSTVSVVNGTAMPSLLPTNSGSPASSWSVSPALPAGITLNTSTGQVSGTPSAIAAAANYTVTATNSTGSSTAVLNITVTAAAVPPSISYSPSSLSLTLNTAMSPLAPTATGTFPTWSVSPALPPGLSLNTQNGTISGTPTEEQASANYTVTATNSGGSVTTTVAITVGATAPSISYAQSSVNYVVNTAIASLLPTNTGSPAASWSVLPALPAGLSFNSNTGQISGTPTATTAAANYTVTATNSAGSSTFVINITVSAALSAPNISYSSSTLSLTTGVAMTALVPSNSGGPVSTWSISPALPAGLAFNTTSGRISGTPSADSASASYTVTASNSAGPSTFVLTVESTTPTTTTAAPATTTTTAAPATTTTTAAPATTTTTAAPATTTTQAPIQAQQSTSTTAAPATTTSTTTTLALARAADSPAATPTVGPVVNELPMLGIKRIIPSTLSTRQTLLSKTPLTCISLGTRVLAIGDGQCSLTVMSLDNDQSVDTWRGQVSMSAAGAGRVITLEPISFGYLEVFPRTSVKKVAGQMTGASEVVVVGHSAILTGQNPWNEYISRTRAENVKNLLRKEGIRTKITVRWLGGTAPLSRVLTEASQAPNRRVMVYVVPKSS